MCLIKTLILTVLVFIICWTPFALCILIDPRGINYHLKKVSIRYNRIATNVHHKKQKYFHLIFDVI